MFKEIKKYEKVAQVIAGISLLTLVAIWLLSRAEKKSDGKSEIPAPDKVFPKLEPGPKDE